MPELSTIYNYMRLCGRPHKRIHVLKSVMLSCPTVHLVFAGILGRAAPHKNRLSAPRRLHGHRFRSPAEPAPRRSPPLCDEPFRVRVVGLPGWRHCRLHSPRAERMTEKIAVTPSARSVQTKKKPLDLAIPAPFMWTTGTTRPRSDPRMMMTYPDRVRRAPAFRTARRLG
jgi:hypothetical protein